VKRSNGSDSDSKTITREELEAMWSDAEGRKRFALAMKKKGAKVLSSDEISAPPFRISLAQNRKIELTMEEARKTKKPSDEDMDRVAREAMWEQIDKMQEVLLQVFADERIALKPEHLSDRCFQIRSEYEYFAGEVASVECPDDWTSHVKDHEQRYQWRPLKRSQITLSMYLAACALPTFHQLRKRYRDNPNPQPHQFAWHAMRAMEVFWHFWSNRAFQKMSKTTEARAALSKRTSARRMAIAALMAQASNGEWSKKKLAGHFKVSDKTIGRDFEQDAELRKLASKAGC
jgi:hypothetical protein